MNFLHVFGMVEVEGVVGVPSWVPFVLLQQPQGDLLDQTDLWGKKINYYMLFKLFCAKGVTYFILSVYKYLSPIPKHFTLWSKKSEGKSSMVGMCMSVNSFCLMHSS
jgi:hypothetical protein